MDANHQPDVLDNELLFGVDTSPSITFSETNDSKTHKSIDSVDATCNGLQSLKEKARNCK